MSQRQALRAPARDGALLAVPPLEEAGRVLARNQALLADRAGLRALARRELVDGARRYLQDRGEPLPPSSTGPLFVAGHQPELFHPGVWVKNFALAGLARRHQGLAVNLIVDNDTVKHTGLRLPVPGQPWPRLRTLPFDRWQGEVPWEERRVAEPDTFARFGDEVTARVRRWGYEPLLSVVWPEVLRHAGGPLGEAFAAARRMLERRWGCHNLEVPLSQLAGGEAFARFAGEVLADLPRFHTLYNATVADYRARHKIRSRNHPVPDLAADGDWRETPLWGWRAGTPRRARLFARRVEDRLELRAGPAAWPVLPAPAAPMERFVTAWQGLARDGFKVRPRALGTTLFARLFLADLFVHGIGGGLYDELTDELIRRFHGLEAPAFLVLSGTLRLPLPAYPAGPDDYCRLVRQVRDVHYNPQRHLSPEQAHALEQPLRQWQEWVAREPDTPAGRRQRFGTLRRLNEVLRAPLAQRERELQRERERLQRELAANAVLGRRDYSFCLYPEATLRPFVSGLL